MPSNFLLSPLKTYHQQIKNGRLQLYLALVVLVYTSHVYLPDAELGGYEDSETPGTHFDRKLS